MRDPLGADHDTSLMRHLGLSVACPVQARGPQRIEMVWHDAARLQPKIIKLEEKTFWGENWVTASWEFASASRALERSDATNQVIASEWSSSGAMTGPPPPLIASGRRASYPIPGSLSLSVPIRSRTLNSRMRPSTQLLYARQPSPHGEEPNATSPAQHCCSRFHPAGFPG